MVLLVIFSIFLDIVQNARDWNEKLNRVFKYMNQWLVQVFVCLVRCVFVSRLHDLFCRALSLQPLSFSNILLTVLDV